MARNQYPPDVFLSPAFAIKRFQGLREKHGNKKALSEVEFKPEREMWITGVFLLGIGDLTHKQYWLRPNNEDTTPDTYSISLLASDKGATAEMQNIEIFEYENHNKNTLIEAITKKLDNKAYPDDYTLLCYIHDRGGEKLTPIEIVKQVKKIKPKIAQIWILANVLNPLTSNEHMLIQVYPEPIVYKFDYLEAIKKQNQVEMIHAKKDLRKMIKEVIFEPIGLHILKLP